MPTFDKALVAFFTPRFIGLAKIAEKLGKGGRLVQGFQRKDVYGKPRILGVNWNPFKYWRVWFGLRFIGNILTGILGFLSGLLVLFRLYIKTTKIELMLANCVQIFEENLSDQ